MPTAIQWADESWNPLRARLRNGGKVGWACEKIAPECAHCYAEHMNVENGRNPARMGTGVRYAADQTSLIEHYLHEETLIAPLKWKKPKRIFPCSMTDVYGSWVSEEWLHAMYAVMALTPQHTYIVLTKRPERRREFLRANCHGGNVQIRAAEISKVDPLVWRWPLPNVIEMASFGTQAQADLVAPIIAATPAARIGLSCEPLLESVVLPTCLLADAAATLLSCGARRLSWLIVGGESGDSAVARPMDVNWARALRRQAGESSIPFFMKQLGRNVLEGGRRIKLRDKKGGNWDEFPETLRWRQEPMEVAQ